MLLSWPRKLVVFSCLVAMLSDGFLFLFRNFTLLSFQVICPFPLCFWCQSDCLPCPDCFHLFPISVYIYGLRIPLSVSVCLVLCTREPAPWHCLLTNCQHLVPWPCLVRFCICIWYVVKPFAPKATVWTSRKGRCPVCIVEWRSWQRRNSKLSCPLWGSDLNVLSIIKQRMDSVCEYAIRFQTLATDSRWNSTALHDVFLKGLSDQIQDLLAPLDLPSSLDPMITIAIRTDNRTGV